MEYPPFVRLVRLELRAPRAEDVEAGARKMAGLVTRWIEASGSGTTRMIGPAPCFFARQAGNYRWQIVLAGPDPARIIKGKDLGGWRIEVDPQALL